MENLLQTELPGLKSFSRGKVRDIYEVGKNLLIVTTDRISAFDVVLPTAIPRKGEALTQISSFWFEKMRSIAPNHLITAEVDEMPEEVRAHVGVLRGRSMLVKKGRVYPVECIVRGYLAGSGWKEYRAAGTICGIKLPPGLREADMLEQPIFTPTTKVDEGHDMPMAFEEVCGVVGRETAERMRDKSIEIYSAAREYAKSRGIIICDTKFEWAEIDGELTLVDELLTPDSSRFWPADRWKPGRSQESFDKQFVRDYLESIGWNKQPPAPALPPEVARKTGEKYITAYKSLTGKEL
ncbi:MAG: phosphoribosylaminoimidazolesuccinocarboxamide synthase [Planctomycetota bacterium]|nr:MAG: phosphoribosylaminoimidazolesuccinocarboxamide synthase [Planctomycetota bacterium]